jgi:hypothetical protein
VINGTTSISPSWTLLGDVFLKVLSSHKLQESCLLNRNDFYTSIKRLLSTTKEAVTLSAPLTQALYNILDIVFGNDSSSPREKVFQIISNSFQHKWDTSKCWLQLKFLLEQFSNADAQSLLDSSPSSIPQFIVSAILCSITRISDTQQSPQQSLQGIESGCLWPGVYHAWLTTLGRDLQNNFLAAVQQILQSPALLNGSGSLYQQLMENRYLHITTLRQILAAMLQRISFQLLLSTTQPFQKCCWIWSYLSWSRVQINKKSNFWSPFLFNSTRYCKRIPGTDLPLLTWTNNLWLTVSCSD